MLGVVQSAETIETLGKFGIALLLFIVGLGLNPRVVRELGKVSFIAGIGQVVVTTGLALFMMRVLGYSGAPALYVSIALAFSSTIVVLKLLSDKKEQNQLHGRIAVGFLLVQDLIATFALIGAAAAGTTGGVSAMDILVLVGKGLLVAAGLILATYYLIRPATNFLAKSQELLFIFALAWGLGAGALFYKIGFSLEVGALFGGVALATMPYAADIGSRLRPLRDFFVVVFFIALGAGLDLSHLRSQWTYALLLSVFVLFAKPLIVMVLMGVLGYTKKTSFKTGLAIGQISEFSIIFLIVGASSGQISHELVGLLTIVGLITFAMSSYMVIYADKLYAWFERYLSLFERRKVKYEQEHHHKFDAILLGYRKGGHEFAKILSQTHKKYIVIDYDPEVIDQLERTGKNYLYGDITDVNLLEEAGLGYAKIVIMTISDIATTEFILKKLQSIDSHAVMICTADTTTTAAHFYELGASYVMVPHTIGSEQLSHFWISTGLVRRTLADTANGT